MATPIIMPKFGQMTEHSAIVEWRKKEGDLIAKGDILFTVETDKSVMDVESFEEGTLLKIAVRPGVNVPVQSIVGFLGKPGEPVPDLPPLRALDTSRRGHQFGAQAGAPPTGSLQPSGRTVAPEMPQRGHQTNFFPESPAPFVESDSPPVFRISPRAAALARRCVIDPVPIHGSGPDGRIV